MFQPETEDMLPRMAPKPSPDIPIGVSDGIARPQVPEVSILFGQQNANLQQTLNQQENKSQPQQTYAAWKKQMLPKISYPASSNLRDMQMQENIIAHDYNSRQPNLYPMRPTTTPPVNMVPHADVNGYLGNTGAAVTNQMTYRRSFESCSNNVYQQINPIIPTLPPQAPLAISNQLPNPTSKDVLTICASTQTDTAIDSSNYLHYVLPDTMSNLAFRKDIENIRHILDEVKMEQQRLLKMFEAFLFSFQSQITVKPQCRDVGVQVDCTDNEESPKEIETVPNKLQLPKNKFLQHLKPTNNISQTPKSKPMAQSTAYRPNSPQFQLLQHDLAQVSSPTNQQVAKSASDTSLAMNELALKYLPNEKLNELLKELNMDCPLAIANTNDAQHTTPVRENIDQFEKGPSDISNASYKYLKKYRLLPEDHENNGNNINNVINVTKAVDGVIENDNKNHLQYNSPQYNVRNAVIDQRSKTNKCSPYTGRLPLSPLARTPATPPLQSSVPQHIVDLENIKHQPKFL